MTAKRENNFFLRQYFLVNFIILQQLSKQIVPSTFKNWFYQLFLSSRIPTTHRRRLALRKNLFCNSIRDKVYTLKSTTFESVLQPFSHNWQSKRISTHCLKQIHTHIKQNYPYNVFFCRLSKLILQHYKTVNLKPSQNGASDLCTRVIFTNIYVHQCYRIQ